MTKKYIRKGYAPQLKNWKKTLFEPFSMKDSFMIFSTKKKAKTWIEEGTSFSIEKCKITSVDIIIKIGKNNKIK